MSVFKLQFYMLFNEVFPVLLTLLVVYIGFAFTMTCAKEAPVILKAIKLDGSSDTATKYEKDAYYKMPGYLQQSSDYFFGDEFSEVGSGFLNLMNLSINNYEFHEKVVSMHGEIILLLFLFVSAIFVVTVLASNVIAAVYAVFADIDGLTFLSQAKDIVEIETVILVPTRIAFWKSLRFDRRIEYDEGDLGLTGGIQIKEAVSQHNFDTSIVDNIIRFPGEAGGQLPWPLSNQNQEVNVENLLDGVEKNLAKIYKQIRELIKRLNINEKAMESSGLTSRSGEDKSNEGSKSGESA
jgi:hypothetical protein